MRYQVEIPTPEGRKAGPRATLSVMCKCQKVYDWQMSLDHTGREMALMIAKSCAENNHEGICL